MSTSKHFPQNPFAKKNPVRGEYQPPAHLAEKLIPEMKVETPVPPITEPQTFTTQSKPKITAEQYLAQKNKTQAFETPLALPIEKKEEAISAFQNTDSLIPENKKSESLDLNQVKEFLQAKGMKVIQDKPLTKIFSVETSVDSWKQFGEIVETLGLKKKLCYEEMFKAWNEKYMGDYIRVRRAKKGV